MTEPILKVTNIETYYGPIMAIRGVSFEVPRGGIVTILGANGAGKTTVLKTIFGVMDPQKGSVAFEGREIQRMDPDKVMRLGISHVPEGREVFPFLSVRENLHMGAYTRHDADGVAQDLEAVFGYFPVLHERADQRAGSLSGGEQQMLAISRALMSRPRLMLLDEPSLGLSPKLVKEIFDIVLRINRERDVTILLVEQNANMALQIADYGYVLEVGRIVMADTSERLLQSDDIKEFYLGIKEEGARGAAAGSGARHGDSGPGDDGERDEGRGRADRDRRVRHDSQAVRIRSRGATRPRSARSGLASGALRLGATTVIARSGRARPGQPRVAARRGGFDPRRDNAEMALCRHGYHGRRRRLQRHLSDRRRQAGRVHPQRQRFTLPVRRE